VRQKESSSFFTACRLLLKYFKMYVFLGFIGTIALLKQNERFFVIEYQKPSYCIFGFYGRCIERSSLIYINDENVWAILRVYYKCVTVSLSSR